MPALILTRTIGLGFFFQLAMAVNFLSQRTH